MAKTFYELKIWQKGYELLMKIYDLTSKFPQEEKYNLTTQLRNSANSVISNIAEAHGRYYFADKIRVLYTSRGETEETRSHLRISFGRRYIAEKTFTDLDRDYEGLSKGIAKYICSLNEQKQNSTKRIGD